MIYPALLMIVAFSSIMLLLTYVVPQFEQIFQQAGKALPLPTQIVIGAGRYAREYWWSLIGAFIVVGYWWRWLMSRASSKFKWDGRFLRLPLFGDLVAKIETARFARTLSTLLGNGVTLLGGLSIVRETMSNTVLSGALDGVIVKLREGRGLAQPLLETGVYPRLASQMIKVGEETGRLEEMLGRVADIYDREAQLAVKRMLALMEPLLILFMAIVIAGVILSILVGIFSVNELADLR
jgi:general secretion pathway protein F